MLSLAADDFADVDDGPPPLAAGFPAGLPTIFFGTGTAFFATADFADLRAGIDFDVAATMYSRLRCRRDRKIPGKAGRLLP